MQTFDEFEEYPLTQDQVDLIVKALGNYTFFMNPGELVMTVATVDLLTARKEKAVLPEIPEDFFKRLAEEIRRRSSSKETE